MRNRLLSSIKAVLILLQLSPFSITLLAQENESFYVYNQTQDTLFFSKIFCIELQNGARVDTIGIDISKPKSGIFSIPKYATDALSILDSVQIDDIGAKELVFSRKIRFWESVHGGTFDGVESTTLTQIEIWNLDTKTQYWSAVTSYAHHFVGNYNREGMIRFEYDFTLFPSGTFELEKTEDAYVYEGLVTDDKINPTLKSGEYTFKNGSYTLEK